MVEPLEDLCVVENKFPHRDKSPHDLDANFHGSFAPQYGGESGNALLGKSVGQGSSELLDRRYRILRYHLHGFIAGELKHEILGKPVGISFHLLPKADRLHIEEEGQVAVKKNLHTPKCVDACRHLGSGRFDSTSGWNRFFLT